MKGHVEGLGKGQTKGQEGEEVVDGEKGQADKRMSKGMRVQVQGNV